MKLYVKNKWISLTGASVVKNEDDKDVFKVKGKFFSFTAKKTLTDLNDNTLYVVRNKFWCFFARKAFVLDKDGKQVALVRRKLFSLRDRYFVDSDLGDLQINGNIFEFDYRITLNGNRIGHISRLMSLRDAFALDIEDGADIPFFVALVIAVDNITDRRHSSNND